MPNLNRIPQSMVEGLTEQLAETMPVINVRQPPYNATGGGTVDDYNAIQTAYNDAKNKGYSLYIPAPSVKYLTSQTLTFDDTNVRVFGDGFNSWICPQDNSFDGIVIGDGVGSGSKPSGWIRDLRVQSNGTPRAANGKAGIKLNAIRQFGIINTYVDNYDIAYDLVNNCFGSFLTNPRSQTGCNVGVNLRTGGQSGNDIHFYNPWLYGEVAAVHVASNSGGFDFFGGQLESGENLTADDDTKGVVILGKDYLTGTTGTMGTISFHGLDLEQIRHIWFFRAFGGVNLKVESCSILANAPNLSALGVFKIENAGSSQIDFDNNQVGGSYSGSKLVVVSGNNSAFNMTEKGTQMSSTVAGTTVNMPTNLMIQSQIVNGSAQYGKSGRGQMLIGGMMIQNTGSAMQISWDWGTTWKTVSAT